MEHLISLRLDTELLEALDDVARAKSLNRSELIRKVLVRFVESQAVKQ